MPIRRSWNLAHPIRFLYYFYSYTNSLFFSLFFLLLLLLLYLFSFLLHLLLSFSLLRRVFGKTFSHVCRFWIQTCIYETDRCMTNIGQFSSPGMTVLRNKFNSPLCTDQNSAPLIMYLPGFGATSDHILNLKTRSEKTTRLSICSILLLLFLSYTYMFKDMLEMSDTANILTYY